MMRTIVRGIGQTLLTLGLITILFAAYEVYGKTWQVIQERKKLDKELSEQWDKQKKSSGDTEMFPNYNAGDPVAKIYAPSLDLTWVVVEGTTPKDIERSPGHYPASQLPGQIGNFAVAAHRSPQLFWDIDKLGDGDSIVVETAEKYYVYKVYQSQVVKPADYYVVKPNPDDPEGPPKRKLLTFTTCNPKFDNYERLIVHAELERAVPKSQGKPKELN